MDFYRARLKAAAWGWMERHPWQKRGGRFRKDRQSGRHEKRGARQDERGEQDVSSWWGACR